MITLAYATSYSGHCEDSKLDDNEQWWTLSDNGTIVLNQSGSSFSFVTQDYGFAEGDIASIAMYCKDWFNLTSTWNENIVIDSVFPIWDSVISYTNDNNEQIILDSNQSMSCLLYTSPSPRDAHESRMPSSA